MSNNKEIKSGNGKVLDETQLGLFESKVSKSNCTHNNSYWLCQQCETRIRNQDIVDRIDYYMQDSHSGHHGYEIEERNESIFIKPNMLTGACIQKLNSEFAIFYYNRNGEFRVSD